MSLTLDGRENKIKLISDTMTGFYSVMRNLKEDYATYHQNYSEEALALLSRSGDFIESVEAVRRLDSLSRIDDEGINELFLLSQQIAELYHLNVQERDKENPVTEVKSEKGFWQTVWGVMKGGRDSPIVRNSLEQVTGAIVDIGDKIGNGLKSGVDWVIENEPDLPVYQRLCNPLFGFFMAGGAVQSWIQNRNLGNTSKNAVENSKAFQKGLADSFIEMGTGLLSLPKAVVDLYYNECEVGDDIAAYLDNCSPEQIPEDFRNWFNKSKEQVKEIGLELKKEVIRQLSEKDVKEYYETFGYLTGTIASLFIGAGEAKAASEAGKVGNATRIENAAITAGKVAEAEKAAEQTSKLRQASEKIENAGKKLKNKASKIKSEIKPKKNCKVIAEANVTVDQQLLQNLSKVFPKYADDIGRIAGKHGNGVLNFIEKNGNSHNMKEIIRIFSNEKNFEYSKFMDFMVKNEKEAIKFMKKYDVEVLKKWNGKLPKYWTSRPPYKDGQVEKVWENAKNGHEFWTDENGVEHIKMGGKKGTVSWDKTKPRNKQGEIPRNGQWDMGHIQGKEYDKLYEEFVRGKIPEKEFIEKYQTAAFYEPQTIHYNRSRIGELK